MSSITAQNLSDKITKLGNVGSLLYASIPPRPYVAERKGSTYRETKQSAIIKDYPYIQLNPSSRCSVLVFDCDNDISLLDWSHIPAPNIIVKHKADNSYKTHLFYVLEKGVPLNELQTSKQANLLYTVQKALTSILHADTGYAGLLAKNPFADSWIAVTCNTTPYSLYDLRAWIDDDYAKEIQDARRVSNSVGFRQAFAAAGRNCAVFEHLRLWAYQQVSDYRQRGGEGAFYAACVEHACMLNDFPVPLGTKEINDIAKSVSRWTWAHYKHDYKRNDSKEHNEEVKKMTEFGRIKGLETRRARHNTNRDKFRTLYQPEQGITIADVCRALGISVRTGKTLLKEIRALQDADSPLLPGIDDN